jgi:hypothetical protein
VKDYRIDEFIYVVRPQIERGEWWFIHLVEQLVESLVQSGVSREELARALLDEFPGNDLAERAAYQIIFPGLH